MTIKVDLNADMGESFGRWTLGDDPALMPYVTSANVACGYHAGDPHVMRATIALAQSNHVGIGAHVALPDLIGFGRRVMSITPEDLKDYIVYQAGALGAFARSVGARVQHVKPHGAMYSMIAADVRYARAMAEAVAEVGPETILLTASPAASDAAKMVGIPFAPEGYVDLDYAKNGSLILERVKTSRDPQVTAARAVRLIVDGRASTVDGPEITLSVKSICIHGDSPNAPDIAKAIRLALEGAGVDVVPLAQLL